jgi:pyruvate formate lyase activating enzyme
MFSRRAFLKAALISAATFTSASASALQQAVSRREARFYEREADGKGVRCTLCPRRCALRPGETGFCRSRLNDGGTLYALSYALPCAIHIDPVEKKPFFNFYPKSRSFSVACAGCNLRCAFCQNWEISQISPLASRATFTPAEQLATLALGQGCKSLAFTYTEPTTFYEYMLDAARAARAKGVLPVYHSNGFINPEPLAELSRSLSGANIDLKGFSDRFYREICSAWLDPVLATLQQLKKAGVWLEITNLVIPGHNDEPQMITDMCRWIRTNLGAETPVHFSRFFPLYRLTAVPPTPVATLERARNIALKEGLLYAYIGNMPGHAGNSTYCPKCRQQVIRRAGFSVLEMKLSAGRCGFCKAKIHGVGLMEGVLKT